MLPRGRLPCLSRREPWLTGDRRVAIGLLCVPMAGLPGEEVLR